MEAAAKPRAPRKARERTTPQARDQGPAETQPPGTDEPQGEALDAVEETAPASETNTGPASRRKANQTAHRAESQAAFAALDHDILTARRKALSTLTGIAAVALAGLLAYGSVTGNSLMLAAAAAAFLAVICLLCWRRERPLTRAEYLSLPHTQARNGRLRCIHCGSLGASLAEVQSRQGGRHDCPKCRKTLFFA